MKRRLGPTILRSAIAATIVLLATSVQAGRGRPAEPLTLKKLDESDLSSPVPWAFLQWTLRDVKVVSLPEPIHMTHEFPLVRLGIIEFLNQHFGFQVLGMEGSLVDAWATQDRFLASNRTEQDAADAQLALFPLWNTPEIQRLFRYEAASWATQMPLYITAYDVQPGAGKGTHGVAAFRLLADRLATYAAAPSGFVLEEWLTDVRPLTEGCDEFTPAKIHAAISAIERLDRWIAAAGAAVAARFPQVPMHAASLRLLPTNLHSSLTLCSELTSMPSVRYKALRDREGAVFAEALRNVSPQAKLMLWAHWSHLTYADPVTGVSVGQQLRQRLGNRLYTILPVAERGTAIVIFPARGSDDDVGFASLRPGSDQFSKRMQALSPVSFFLDLRDSAVRNDDAFVGEQRVWIESRAVRLPLVDATDAIVWLKHVSPPRLRLPLLLVLGAMHYRKALAASAVLSLVLLGWSALAWRRRTHKAAN
jgi:erythromycin esterase-like protein